MLAMVYPLELSISWSVFTCAFVTPGARDMVMAEEGAKYATATVAVVLGTHAKPGGQLGTEAGLGMHTIPVGHPGTCV